MTKDEILSMAKEAGMFAHTEVQPEIIRFAALVAAKEREANAKVCDDLPAPDYVSCDDESMWDVTSLACADAIRARGQK